MAGAAADSAASAACGADGEQPLTLRVRDLRTHFFTPEGVVPAVDGVSLDVPRGRTVALVGESGCGKSVTALSILRLVPPPGRIVGGQVLLDGRDLLALGGRAMRGVRGNRVAMIFQEPLTSLNPVLRVGEQIGEALRVHRRLRAAARRRRIVELLSRVGIPAPEVRAAQYPHQMSGGMRQRVMIAMALACEPELLIADEPTTALDVTMQAQILGLLREAQEQAGMAVLLITHDLGLVTGMAQAVYVMYAGRIVESAPLERLFATPLHPYTRALLRSVPRLAGGGGAGPGGRRARLFVIPGEVPQPQRRPPGCAFHPRCEQGREDPACRRCAPPLTEIEPGHACACWQVLPAGGRGAVAGSGAGGARAAL